MFPSNLMAPQVGQRGSKLSPRLWSRLIEEGLSADGSAPGVLLVDDFNSFPSLTVTTAAGQLQPPSGYFAYIEADATVGSIKQNAADPSVITLLTSTDSGDGDNHQTSLGTCGNTGTLGAISDTGGADKLTICEMRFRLNSVTDGDGSVFLGLGEEGLGAAATPLADDTGHKLASKDLIGFVVSEDNNDSLKFQYRKAGQAIQTVSTYGTALAAGTYYNVGFVYDPAAPESERIKIYVDNVEQTDKVTAANIAAATFPDGEKLAMYAAIIGSGNNDPQHFDLDLWAFYQAG
tara:strand:+ start:393 stop:1265 length:873 start_codon:yes stop_codon:yes gene_type:complete